MSKMDDSAKPMKANTFLFNSVEEAEKSMKQNSLNTSKTTVDKKVD